MADWHIIGRGSIGLLWASELCKLNHQVNLIVKNHQGPSTEQLTDLTSNTGVQSQFTVTLSGYDSLETIHTLLVPLKAYDILAAIEQIKPQLTPQTVIILCHNGMGTIEQVQQLLGKKQPLLFATTTHGAYRLNAAHVRHTGLGETKMGRFCPPLTKQLTQILDKVLTPVTWHEDINAVLWQKLAINCVINPLTASLNVKNGQLADVQYEQTINSLCNEIAAVANACGIGFVASDLRDNCYKVIKGTANNYSSMHQDVKASRTTEIDYINGYLLGKARQFGIEAPANEALYQAIKTLESTSS
jgi:2-dehydropantoate 2-reductase